MKTLYLFFISLAIVVSINYTTKAQVDVDVEKKVVNKTDQRANSKTDQAIDKGFDKIEDGIGSLFGKKKKKKEKESKEVVEEKEKQTEGSSEEVASNKTEVINEVKTPQLSWSKFDFVPGDEVIFEDWPSADEDNGEFPSRWDLKDGSVEIAELDGEPVIMFIEGGTIVPYMENSRDDYLPEIFTIEFDAWWTKEYSGKYWVYFYDRKNQKSEGKQWMTIYVNNIGIGSSDMTYPGKKRSNWDEVGGWRHISIAFTKGKLKAYMDDTRLINIPHYEGNPTGLSIQADDNSSSQKFIKNIRIAKGGVKYYDRFLSDGKIIVNGIKFDINKATLKPESMGPINKIYKLLEKNPDINFSVEGHTDSDGDETTNQTLSEQRAKAVMDQLIKLGINADRLSYKGFGESKPLDINTTPEGRANNRRVEFVKK